MSTRTSRRSLLAGLAVSPLAATPALATPPNPDNALIVLVGDYFRAYEAYMAAEREETRLRADWRALSPAEPNEMRRTGDFRYFWGAAHNPRSEIFYTHGEVSELREFTGIGHLHAKCREAAVARAREITDAYDRWQESKKACADACGWSEAGARCEAAVAAREAIAGAVKAARPTSLEGFIAKARVGQVEGWAEFDAALRDDLVALGGEA